MTAPLPLAPRESGNWSQFFDEFAPHYEETAFGGAGLTAVGARELAVVRAAFAGTLPGPVLDAGAGTGRLARALAGDGWSVTALDASPEMLAQLARRQPSVTTVSGRLGAPLPLTTEAFDAVVSMRVLKYVEDLDLALAELARVARSGAPVVLEFANRRSAARYGYRNAPVYLRTRAEIQQTMGRAGFDVHALVAGTRLPHPVWRALPRERGARVAIAVERALDRVLPNATAARSVLAIAHRR